MFIRYIVKPFGIHARLRIETVSEATPSFARVLRQSNSVDFGKIYLRNMRGGLEIGDQHALDLVTTNEMRIVAERLDRVSSGIVWNGDVDNSVNGYRECDGIVKQVALLAHTVEWTNSFRFDMFFKKHQSDIKDKDLLDLSWRIAARPRVFHKYKPIRACNYWHLECTDIKDVHVEPHIFTSDVYILPCSKEPDDNGVYFQRVDYSDRELQRDRDGVDLWHTDDGEFLWKSERDKWDFSITCQTEFRIAVPKPELVTIIKNVPVELEQLRCMQCQPQS